MGLFFIPLYTNNYQMIVDRIIRYIEPDSPNGGEEITVRKHIDPEEIVSFEEFISGKGTKSLYVYSRTHEFVIKDTFESFNEKLKMAKLV